MCVVDHWCANTTENKHIVFQTMSETGGCCTCLVRLGPRAVKVINKIYQNIINANISEM